MKIPVLIFCLLLPAAAFAEDAEAPPPPTPEQLAATSDIIVVAQLLNTDYEYIRDYPSGGKTLFKTLISYKAPRTIERFIVHEEGVLKENGCYFPDDPLVSERPRYLLFLTIDEEGDFRGNPAGCMLDVLVDEDYQYVIRWPQDNLQLDDDAQALIDEYRFTGPGARISTRDFIRPEIVEMQEKYSMRREDDELVYTQGIELSEFRKLMGEDGVNERASEAFSH